jgi:hypothetical protein
VSRFFSIPGCRPHQNEGRGGVPVRERLLRDPRYAEYYESKGQGPPVTGFSPGEEIDMRGTPARVIGEEYDAHRGVVEMHVQESSRVDSGTKKIIWHQTGDGGMAIGDIRKITE